MDAHDLDAVTAGVDEAPGLTPRRELELYLAADERRIGDVYRFDKQGLSPDEIADRLDIATPGFVYNYRAQVAAALDGSVGPSPTMQRQVLSALRSLLRRGRDTLSTDALSLLEINMSKVEQASLVSTAVDEAAAIQSDDLQAATSLSSLSGVPGIYAFSYGWYLESPIDPARGNTLIKVGRAADVAQRIRSYVGGVRTHMPEPLVLVRVYSAPGRDLAETEKLFHNLLSTAGHGNPRRSGASTREVGKEWYLTNEDFLDSIAEALKLRTEYIGQSEFGDA